MLNRVREIYMSPWGKFGTLSGRALRSEYWTFVLVNAFVSFALTAIDISFGLYSEEAGLGLFGALFGFVVMLPTIAVTVRRLHDSGLSGWWFLIVLVPFVGWIVHLINMAKAGTRGSNRFGADVRGDFTPEMPMDGDPPYATASGGRRLCPWCGQSNPPERTACQWCHKAYRE